MKRELIMAAVLFAALVGGTARAGTPEGPAEFVVRAHWEFDGRTFKASETCDLRRTAAQACQFKVRTMERDADVPMAEFSRYWTYHQIGLRRWDAAEKFDVHLNAERDGLGAYRTQDDEMAGGDWERAGVTPEQMVQGIEWPMRRGHKDPVIGKLVITFTPVGEEWAGWGRAEDDLSTVAKVSPAATDGAVAASEISKQAEAKPWWKVW